MNSIIVFVCAVVALEANAWSLRRATQNEESASSRIIFKNTTVTGKFTLVSWSWRDSLAGLWDTSLRVSLANVSFYNGHLQYRDGYGKQMLRVRWRRSPFTNLTWRALFDGGHFPPNSWNMSSDFVNWGYRPFGERTWAFYVGEQLFEAKVDAAVTIEVRPPLDNGHLLGGLWTRRRRRKRSLDADRTTNFNLLDVFTEDGFLAQIPQLLMSLLSLVANFLPAGRSNDYHANETGSTFTTEPEAEMISTEAATESDIALRRTAPRL